MPKHHAATCTTLDEEQSFSNKLRAELIFSAFLDMTRGQGNFTSVEANSILLERSLIFSSMAPADVDWCSSNESSGALLI